jgi:hypothetical protein
VPGTAPASVGAASRVVISFSNRLLERVCRRKTANAGQIYRSDTC